MTDFNENTPTWSARPIPGSPQKDKPSTRIEGRRARMPDDTALRPSPGDSERHSHTLRGADAAKGDDSADPLRADNTDQPHVGGEPAPVRSQAPQVDTRQSGNDGTARSTGGLKPWLLAGGAMLLLFGFGIIVAFFSFTRVSESDNSVVEAQDLPPGGLDASSDDEIVAGIGPAPEESPQSTAGEQEQDFGTVAEARQQSAHARLDGLSLHLEGSVPSQEVGDKVEAKAADLLGQPAVKANYTVDPDIPLPADPPLFASSAVLFEPDGTVSPGSAATLNIALTLLVDYPDARVIVTTPLPDRLEPGQIAVSETHAKAVRQFWVEKGLDPARVKVEVEETPDQGDASPEGAAVEREIEFVVSGLLETDQL